MKFHPFLLTILAGLLSSPNLAVGDLVLNLSGIVGNSTINWEATGTGVTVTQAYPALASSDRGRAPTVGSDPDPNSWDSSFDANLGDILSDFDDELNDDLPLGSGGVSYRKNDVEFAVLDLIDFDPDAASGQDDIELGPSTTQSYPALASGDTLTWTGSGTLTLESGTFDSIFTPGSYSSPIDGGNYVVNVAIPEPSAFLFFGLIGIGLTGAWSWKKWRRSKAPQ